MKYCSSCGKQLDDDAVFCGFCGAEQTAAEPAKESAVAQNVEPEPAPAAQPNAAPATEPTPAANAASGEKKGAKAKVLAMRDKTVAFEKKHNLIVNLLVLCCSIVILFVALFAPVKVSGYCFSNGALYADGDEKEVTYTYVEVDQTIFDMIGSLFYVAPSAETLAEVNKDYSQAMSEASREYQAWRVANQYADQFEMNNARAEIVEDHLSDINILAYILATKSPVNTIKDIVNRASSEYDGSGSSDGETSIKDVFSGDYVAALISAILGVVITILAIVMAIMSLVYLIKAIIGLCKKTNPVKFGKYMLRMFALSGASLALMWVSPMIATGGGMFAISMFIAITMLVTGVIYSLFVRGDYWVEVLKRGIIQLLCMISFYLLCTNIFSYTVTRGSSETGVNVKPGYGFYNLFNLVEALDGGTPMSSLMHVFIGFFMYVFTAGFIMSWMYKSYSKSVRHMVKGEESKLSAGIMIAAAVLTLVGIIYGFLSGTMIEALSRAESSATGSVATEYSWTMRAQVWVALVFTIGAIVLHYVLKPEKIGKKPVAATAGGESAPAAQNDVIAQPEDATAETEQNTAENAQEPAATDAPQA